MPMPSSLPLIIASSVSTMIAKALTFMPPATEPVAPPISISPQNVSEVYSLVSLNSTVLKPAVRPLVDSNAETSSFSPTGSSPIVLALSCSNSRNVPQPNSSSAPVTISTNLVLSANSVNLRVSTMSAMVA